MRRHRIGRVPSPGRRSRADSTSPQGRGGFWAAAFLLAFVLLTGIAVTAFGTPGIDVALSRLAATQRDHAGFWHAVTTIGGGEARAALGLLAAALLWLRGRGRDGVILLSVALVQTGANSALKALFGRARPDLYPHLDHIWDQSFPSGHSAQNAALWLLAALLIDRRLLWIAVPVVALIGVSRVVLGVHWPSDVLAGWAEGAAFALLGLCLHRGLASRRT